MPAYLGNRNNQEAFDELINSPPPVIAIDVETISLEERMPLGFGISTRPDEAFYIRTYPEPETKSLERLIPVLSNPNITKVFHNCIFDLRAFPLIPIVGSVLDQTNIWDTNVAARLLGHIETQLCILAREVGMEITPASELLGPKQTMLDLPDVVVARHCMEDAEATIRLYDEYKDYVDKDYFATEMSVIPVLINMSLRGLKVDEEARAKLQDELEYEVEFYEKIIHDAGIEKPGSPQQVGYILAKRGNFLPLTRSKKQLSTREAELEFLDDSLASAVLKYRQSKKLLSTYILPLQGEDRIYTEYNLDAVVGRVSSSRMNMQNIPGPNSRRGIDCRHIFLPDSGLFTTFDYTQEHLYILMHLSGDTEMRKVYEEGYMDGDIHSYTAREMGVPRVLAKTLNYAVIYGATARTVMEQAKIRDLQKCSRLLDNWFDTFKEAAYWIREVQAEGLRTGWAIPTLFGRKIRIPDEKQDAMMRKAVNYPIIGSDGEVIKRAILLCNSKGLGPPAMVVTVHDSITFDGDVELPVEELELIPGFRIPVDVKQTFTWE
jgi:DNA polymerase-1|tara:strand:+ start:774 stop:2417 length:1644 start_codon:yes stop_codon:yes gene_type:complete